MFDIEKMKAKGMDPVQIEICRQINENNAKRDSCRTHEFEKFKGSRPGEYICKNCGCKESIRFVAGYRQGLEHGNAERLAERNC